MNIFYKNLIAFSLSVFSLTLIVAAEPSRFPINPNGIWKVYITQDSYGGVNPANEEYLYYYISNDTIINTQSYYKIYKKGVAFYDEPFYYDQVYVGALRDEGNKVYYIKKDQTVEELLFDYNLKLDDTIKSVIGNNHIINEVDSLPDGRKIFGSVPFICAGCCPAPVLIEGISHAGGLFEDPPCNHPGYQYNELVCYTVDDEILYQNEPSNINCNTFTSIKPVPTDISSIHIYPVPASNELTLEFSEKLTFPLTLNILDISGSLIHSHIIPLKTGKLELNVQDLKKGIYSITIKNSIACISKRFIIE